MSKSLLSDALAVSGLAVAVPLWLYSLLSPASLGLGLSLAIYQVDKQTSLSSAEEVIEVDECDEVNLYAAAGKQDK